MRKMRRLDLQAKIIGVLIAVILPTFLVITVVENKLTQPILEDEVKQVGITTARTLAAEIISQKLLSLPDPSPRIESIIQELIYSHPNIVRLEVAVKDPVSGLPKTIASNIEDDPTAPPPTFLTETLLSEFKKDDDGTDYWELSVPIEQKARDPKIPKKILGSIHVLLSMKFIGRIMSTLFKVTAGAAALSVVILVLVLSYFLRKTIDSDRRLRKAESKNVHLAEQLLEAERRLLHNEKLAVMGQLTASFAHEIGTPLNAVGGHLQLLKEELGSNLKNQNRFDVITGQLDKIEQIVKNFLQSTSKPVSQRQLLDLNLLADKSIDIIQPRVDSLGVELKRELDRGMAPIRAVPIEIEQIVLNFLNNSLDSLRAKERQSQSNKKQLAIITKVEQGSEKDWATLEVYDTGVGIPKKDLVNVFRPFFTTKGPGEGTGLGLNICQDLAKKYGGIIEIDSKMGSWTRARLKIPYQGAG